MQFGAVKADNPNCNLTMQSCVFVGEDIIQATNTSWLMRANDGELGYSTEGAAPVLSQHIIILLSHCPSFHWAQIILYLPENERT
jgi:hypothetical protein